MVCCSFLEEDMSRTNCLIEREMYSLFDEFIEQGDTVMEVGCLKVHLKYCNCTLL